MSLNFTDSLEKTAADIKRPPILPVGTYEWVIKRYEFDQSNDGKWDICTFHLSCTAPGEDVDPDDLAAYGKPQGSYMRFAIMFNTEDPAEFSKAEYRLKRFLTDHVKCWDESSGKSLKQGIDDAVGQKISGVVRWKADRNDAEVQYAEIARTAPVA